MSDEEKIALAELYLYLHTERLKYSRNTYLNSKLRKYGSVYGVRMEYTKKLKKISKYYSKLCGHKLNYSIAKEILDQKGFY